MRLLQHTLAKRNYNGLIAPRMGVMLHYDDSASDRGALGWLTADPTCKVSYNVLVTDDGVGHEIAPLDKRAWHAGVCVSSDPVRLPYRDANSAFYGVAVAARDGEVVTPAQFAGVVGVVAMLAAKHGWDLRYEGWRIVGHNTEAWPRGRKVDPVGLTPNRPVLSVAAVRAAFAPAAESDRLAA